MVEVEDLSHIEENTKGFSRSTSSHYNETISVHPAQEGHAFVSISTTNVLDKAREAWWVDLNKEQTIALARHLLNLARDMD